MPLAQKTTRHHPADDQLVVAGSASIRDSAIKKGQSILEDGRAAVHSLHIHVVPSYDGKPIDWSTRVSIHPMSELEPEAAKLRAALNAQH